MIEDGDGKETESFLREPKRWRNRRKYRRNWRQVLEVKGGFSTHELKHRVSVTTLAAAVDGVGGGGG